MLPGNLKDVLEDQLNESVTDLQGVSGGSINRAARLTLEKSGAAFLKWNTSADPAMFLKEKKGLELLRSSGADLIIPEVLAVGTVDGGTGYLLLEYIEQGGSDTGDHEQFGRELAGLHRVQNEQYGLDHDNFIGRLPQSNTKHENWTEFFIEERMKPQLKMALDAGKLSGSIADRFERMYRKLPAIFPEEPPSLLHGDLWGGNYFYSKEGKATLYDPAVYYGHREIELAFTRLFGGFSGSFYKSYEEIWTLQPDFESRVDIYNLYPLLVHTNLFGGHYGNRVQSIVSRFG
ncbi:MAG: fructosamine kinase family protein [Balneolaceae bacterium]|nr:fructosamine kinase family protein [Balneolaceae bacterium]